MEQTKSSPAQCRYVECGRNLPNGGFTRNHICTIDKINDFRFKYNNTGVYTTVYRYDSPEQDEASFIAPFYLDLDAEGAFEDVRRDALFAIRYLHVILNIRTDSIGIYFSGKKGVHIVVPHEVLGVEPSKNLNAIYKLLAEDIADAAESDTIDLSIYDNKRMFRLPHSIHASTNLYKIPLTYDELKSLSQEEIMELATEPRPSNPLYIKEVPQAKTIIEGYRQKIETLQHRVKKVTYDKTLDITPPCIQDILENTVPSGRRNNTSIALASFFRQRGYDQETAEGMLYTWSQEHCNPPLNERELDTVLKQAYEKGYKYGCNRLKNLAECNPVRCKLRGGIK